LVFGGNETQIGSHRAAFLEALWILQGQHIDIFGTGAILVGLAFVAVAFGIGYFTGRGADHLQDVGGLGTAQRNTAAGLIIATQSFDDPNVLVMLTLANTLGIVMLLLIARALSRDNKVDITPV
jgi:BASS family bile acid:Na+ symporter